MEVDPDNICEVVTEDCIQGKYDTVVDEADADTNTVYIFAPGENQKPLGMYSDKDVEYLCFPTIFCGQTREQRQICPCTRQSLSGSYEVLIAELRNMYKYISQTKHYSSKTSE